MTIIEKLNVMKPYRKESLMILWNVPFNKWEQKHYEEFERLKKGQKPKLLAKYKRGYKRYVYYLDGKLINVKLLIEKLNLNKTDFYKKIKEKDFLKKNKITVKVK